MPRSVGKMGESVFEQWAHQVGIVPNKVQRDETGWDYFIEFPHERVAPPIIRACRKTTLRVTGGLLACLFPLYGSCFFGSASPDTFSPHLSACTRSRINLCRLKERIDRGPAISSVCHRRSLGLLNPYLSVFRVPMIPSVLPRSLLTRSRTASATCQVLVPLGWIPICLAPSRANCATVAVASPPRSYTTNSGVACAPKISRYLANACKGIFVSSITPRINVPKTYPPPSRLRR